MRYLLAFVLLISPTVLLWAADDPDPAQAAKDRAVVETLLRLKGVDVNSSPAWKAAALRYLETLKGTPRYVELAEKLKLRGVEDELFRLAVENPSSTTGARAAALLVRLGETARFERAVRGEDEPAALQAIAALGTIGDRTAVELLRPVIADATRSVAIRTAAANAIGKNRDGQQFLLELTQSGQLPQELRFTAANILLSSADPAVREAAAKHLSLPATANSEPIPPVAELVKMTGDAARGKQVFQTTGTCAKCHKVRGEGKEVGPDLTEIGSKLSKDALFVSILDPSAGISHNYESYVAITTGGTVVTGLLVNRTDDSVTIRTPEAIDKQIPTAELDELEKSKASLMPADLQKLLTVQELVDVVEYLSTLKKSA